MPGQLFTHYFLTDGIKATPEWNASVDRSETFANFRDGLLRVYTGFSEFQEPNEAVTEQRLIRPILELLGWADYLPQQGASRNEDIPDHLLFADRESAMRAAAKNKPDDRFRDALAVEESKRFGLALDARDTHGRSKIRHSTRPDLQISLDSRDRVGQPYSMGNTDRMEASGAYMTPALGAAPVATL